MSRTNRGFTLIEVMITIAILATLTIMTTQAISQAIQAKGKLQSQLDDVSRLRDALRLIERDVNLAYHYRDVEKELKTLVSKTNNNQQNKTPQPGGLVDPSQVQPVETPTPTPQVEAPRKDPATHFVGSEEALDFVTMNNARIVRNTKQADFVEIGYSLRDCRNRRTETTSKCLWRRSSSHVDLDVTKGGKDLVLLENVSEFKLRYIGKGKQDWTSSWRTDAGGDGTTKNNFPQAVEVSITTLKTEKGRQKKYSMQLVIPIHFPNNPEEKSNANTNSNSGLFNQ